MELTAIFKNIKEEFCSLWQFKQRGQTLEIITPYSTTSNKFVSVFLTYKDKEFIVSDGGWLSMEAYEAALDFDDDYFSKIFSFYENHYEVKSVNSNSINFYYKKTHKAALVPSITYDMASFISSIASAAQVQFQDVKEKDEKKRFNREATTYITSLFIKKKDQNLYFRKSLSDEFKSIKFSAIVEKKSNLTLINYVTGSTVDYFIGSIGKANITFEVADNSHFSKNVKQKIALVNNKATGFDKARLYKFLEQLENTTQHQNIFWHEKEKLAQFI